MKRLISTILAASMMLLCTSAFAQISVGAGYINSSSKTTISSTTNSVPSNGFYAGADYAIQEGAGFGVTVGAYYTYLMKNSSASTSLFGINIGGSSKIEEMYIDIPVNFKYSADLGGATAFVYAGPTFSLGLSSTTDTQASIAGFDFGKNGKYDNYSNGDYGRFDILVGGGIGVDINNIRFTVGYNVGMLNRIDSDTYKQTRNVLHAGVAFLF